MWIHFLFVGVSKQTGETMMVTHNGSRGLGANLFDQGMKMAEFNLGEVMDEIIPYGCIMAGDWEIDAPWRQKWKSRPKKNP